MSRREDKKAKEQFEALMAQNAKTRALDRLDVREGRLSSQALSWFSQDYVRSLTLTVPEYGMPVSEGAMEETARTAPEFAALLRAFLATLPEPRLVLSDHPTDFSLLARALGGFGSGFTGDMPTWQAIEVTQGDVLGHRELYFDRHAEARQRRHHAGVDVEALRWAFEYVIEGAMQ